MLFKRSFGLTSSLFILYVLEHDLLGFGMQGRSQKKLMTEAMSMEDLWPRQSVHGWVLFLGIKSVYKQQKVKEITEASASVRLLLATAVGC